MEMIGETRLKIYMKSIGKSVYDDRDTLFIDASDEFDFIKKDDLDKKISYDELETLFSDFEIIYNEDSWVDDFVEVTYSDSLITIEDEDIVSLDDDLSAMKVSDTSEYNAGDVIGFIDPNTNYPTVRKIEDISEDGTLTLSEDVDISEVLVDALCSDIEEISIDNMVLSGFEEVSNNNSTAGALGWKSEASSQGFKIHYVAEKGAAKIEIEDEDSGVTLTSSYSKADTDCDITLDVSDIYAMVCWEKGSYAEVIFSDKVSASVQTHSKDLVDKKIKVFESKIPAAYGLLWVKFEFYVVFDAEGSISVEIGVPSYLQASWSKESGFAAGKQDDDGIVMSVTGNVEGKAFFRTEAAINFMNIGDDVIDAELDVGMSAKAEATIRDDANMVCADVGVSFPVIKLSVCGDVNEDKHIYRSLIGKLQGGISFDLIDEDSTPKHEDFHFEIVNGIGGKVNECTYGKSAEDAINEPQETTGENTTEVNVQNPFGIDVYEILGQVSDYPLYFLVDSLPDGQENFLGQPYAVTDNGDSYVVTGTVKALDVILKDTGIENMEEGDTVTSVLGTEYIVTYNDHANNGNWVGIDMKDSEGNVYHIQSGLSGAALTSPYVYVQDDNGTDVVKTYDNISFEVPTWSTLIYPCSVAIPDIGGENSIGYQGIYMADDGKIYSHDEANSGSASPVYDGNGNVIVD
jgi:hypothetical protein